MRVLPLLLVLGPLAAAVLPPVAMAQTPDGTAWRVIAPTGGGPRASSPEVCHVLYGGQCTIDLDGVRGPPSPDIPFPKVTPPEDVAFRPAGGLEPAAELTAHGATPGVPGTRRDPPPPLTPRPGAATSDIPMPPGTPMNIVNPSPSGTPMTERTEVTGRTGVTELDTLVEALKASGLGDQLRPNVDPKVPGVLLVAPGNALAPAPPPAAAARRAPVAIPTTVTAPPAAPATPPSR